jgi:hypothetical protein
MTIVRNDDTMNRYLRKVHLFRLLVLLDLLLVGNLFGQERLILRGEVIDGETRKPVPQVNVLIRGQKIGMSTDSTGSFRLALPIGVHYVVVFSHVAYHKVMRDVFSEEARDIQLQILLQPEPVQLQEVTVLGRKPVTLSKAAIERAAYRLDGAEFERLGEPDMEKAMEYLLPTVVERLETRMSLVRRGDRLVDSPSDFTLYVNGEWKESLYLDDIDPFSVRRVLVWDVGPFDSAPLGLPLRRGARYVVLVQTK